MLEIVIDNRDGYLWDISGLISELTYKTSRIGKASSVEFTYIKGGLYEEKEYKVDVGNVVTIKMDGINVFYGYIFTIESGRDEEVKVVAYDQLRYLMTNDTYVFKEPTTATGVIKRIADDFGLKVGTLEDTVYKIPTMIFDDKKLFDIICDVLDKTLIATVNNFVFYDDFGSLTLKDMRNMVVDIIIGDESLMFEYKQKYSIDNSYNRIKLVQNNEKSGKRDVYIIQDSANIAKWGRLQYYKVVDEKMNEAQINELLNNIIKLKNREQRSFTIESIGDIRVRAGNYVNIHIDEIGVENKYWIHECTHKFDGDEHTMTLELIGVMNNGFIGTN